MRSPIHSKSKEKMFSFVHRAIDMANITNKVYPIIFKSVSSLVYPQDNPGKVMGDIKLKQMKAELADLF